MLFLTNIRCEKEENMRAKGRYYTQTIWITFKSPYIDSVDISDYTIGDYEIISEEQEEIKSTFP